ncbi:MAG TPA: efflux RND transporter periplasmic adaptor subunit [candidate division Zixibacteria bacterium]|jgi:HlyD family secretion protein|nr:efflux RND transporter periplasmic adaptor subunit [candidate division Zixibacteria bacterium]
MSNRTKLIIGILVVAGISLLAYANIKYQRKETVSVRTQTVVRRDLVARVSASGKIETTRKVDVSASISGKVIYLPMREGDLVEEGTLLFRIDPTQTQTLVTQFQAGIRSAKTNIAVAEANQQQAKIEYERQKALFDRNVIAEDLVQRARSAYDVEIARTNGAKEEIVRLEAQLKNAVHDLTKVNVHADISGVVTKLNIHEGENAFVGTFNNPGTVLMTISDLNHMEAWVEVDETDVVNLRVGQPAEIIVDAYPDTVFHAVIDRIGNSPITETGSNQQAVNFEVVILLTDTIPNVRPGLSCVADIITGTRRDVLSIPIQALTVREPEDEKKNADGDDDPPTRRRNRAHEGIFVIEEDRAFFRHVTTGLTGERHFEILSGLEENSDIIIGPFETLRTIKDSTLVEKDKGGKL